MLRGLDTTFLVEAEVIGHPGHAAARAKMEELLGAGDTFALAPQVTAEFVHVVTDPRRFAAPLSVPQAVLRAESWWEASEVTPVYPDRESVRLFLSWLREHGLGRKRILDTLLAATYYGRGIHSIVSSNVRDYAVFGCFDVIVP